MDDLRKKRHCEEADYFRNSGYCGLLLFNGWNHQIEKRMRIYLAARYSRRLELCEYREQLRSLGYDVQARWLDGKHQLSNEGVPIGDNGEALVEDEGPNGSGMRDLKSATLRAHFANDDWQDVTGADCVISFTEPPRSSASRGGRHVEHGIAMGRGIWTIVVGYRENIFHWLPDVIFAPDWGCAIAGLNGLRDYKNA